MVAVPVAADEVKILAEVLAEAARYRHVRGPIESWRAGLLPHSAGTAVALGHQTVPVAQETGRRPVGERPASQRETWQRRELRKPLRSGW